MQLALPGTVLAAGFRGCSGTLGEFCRACDFAIGTLPGNGGVFTFDGGQILGTVSDDCCPILLGAEASMLEGARGRLNPPDAVERMACPPGDNQFMATLAGLMPSPNYGYAIRVEGTFGRARVTSRAESVRGGGTLEKGVRTVEGVTGVLLGFYLPPWLETVAWAGCRFHFLSEDRRIGGRLLDCEIAHPRISLRHVNECRLAIPGTADFHLADLGGEGGTHE